MSLIYSNDYGNICIDKNQRFIASETKRPKDVMQQMENEKLQLRFLHKLLKINSHHTAVFVIFQSLFLVLRSFYGGRDKVSACLLCLQVVQKHYNILLFLKHNCQVHTFLYIIYIWLRSLWVPWAPFQFLYQYTVSTSPWTGDQPVARTLPKHKQHKHRINAHRHPCLERD
jgi:hypothetical protein